jgi:hypothetical protein
VQWFHKQIIANLSAAANFYTEITVESKQQHKLLFTNLLEKLPLEFFVKH